MAGEPSDDNQDSSIPGTPPTPNFWVLFIMGGKNQTFHSITHSFNKHILRAYYVPGTVVSSEDMAISKTEENILSLWSLRASWRTQ